MRNVIISGCMMLACLSGCCSMCKHQPGDAPTIYVEGLAVNGIKLDADKCTAEYVQSKLGTPTRIDNNGKMLRYTEHGIDLWFSDNQYLSEIHLNRGFTGCLDSGISMTSSKHDVFKAYGQPVKHVNVDNLHQRNVNSILYTKEDASRIYYRDHGLIFWFKGEAINQIVPFKGKLKEM